MKSPPKNWMVSGALLVWAGLVFHYYFSLKTAFDLSFLSTVFSAFPRADLGKLAGNWTGFFSHLLCAATVSFVLWRLGRKLLLWTSLEGISAVVRFCLEMAFGIILTNTLWLGLGLNGLWFASLQWILGLALLGWALWDFYRSGVHFHRFPKVSLPGKLFLGLGFLGLLSCALDLLQGMTPDVYYDALVYHLSTPQFWEFHHGITDFYMNLYSYFPLGAELYFGNGLFFGGTETAKMLNAFCAGFCGLAAAGWVAGECGWDKGLLTWAAVLTLPLVSATVWTTQNDVVLAFFIILFLYLLIRWTQDSAQGCWALAAGILGGAALTVKYTAVVSVGVSLLVVIFAFHGGKPFDQAQGKAKRPATVLPLFGLMALSIAPWLIKNWAFTGNPLYPYFPAMFGGRALPTENLRALMNDHEAVFNGSFSFWDWAVRVLKFDLDKTIAPLLLGFIPFLFLGGKRGPLTRFFLLLGGLLLLSGFLVSHQLRLMIPAFVVCFTAMALVLGDIEWEGAAIAWGGIVALFGVLSLLSLGRFSVGYYQTQKMALGAQTREEYLSQSSQTSTYYGLARAARNLLPPGARILVVGDARGLYYPRTFYASSVFDEQVLPRLAREEKDAEGIRKRLLEMGIDALAVSGEEGHRLAWEFPFHAVAPAEFRKLDNLVQHWTDPLFFSGLSGIYRLRNTAAGSRPAVPDLLELIQTTDPTKGHI